MPAWRRRPGLTREQAVRVYSFETGGNGNHDMQSGLSASRPGSRAISTAVGYNQLLTTNSVELLAEQGQDFVRALTERGRATVRGAAPGDGAQGRGAEADGGRSRARCRTIGRSTRSSAIRRRAGRIHAMVLDIDVGPMLQTHKLLTSVVFARVKGYTRALTAAELEMMNLTGDGTGLDMVTMPQAMRVQVPTSNFFQRSGYERNPVAIRHNTVAKLLASPTTGWTSTATSRAPRNWRRRFRGMIRKSGYRFSQRTSAMQSSGRRGDGLRHRGAPSPICLRKSTLPVGGAEPAERLSEAKALGCRRRSSARRFNSIRT